MTDQKPTPETPDENGSSVEDLDITVVRAPETAVYDTSSADNETEAYDFSADAGAPVPAETGAPTVAQPADEVPAAAPDEPVVAPVDPAPLAEPTNAAEPIDPADPTSPAEPGHIPPQYGIGPFSLREVSLLGVWALAFIFSFFPLYGDSPYTQLLGGSSVWSSGIDWILAIGVPTVAVFLLVLRRFSPDGIRRVGSLGIDQFASVAFSVSAVLWLSWLWNNIARGAATGIWLSSWVVWVEVILMAAGVALTVVAPFIPPFHEDFLHRSETVSHRVARGARPVVARPISDARFTMAAPSVDPDPAPLGDPIEDDEPAPAPASAHQAFWALAPVERDVVDENGTPLFRIGPTAWALVIEDRGDSFVVRHEDGRIGYLTDVSGVTRG
ncbi:hypothetical protein [Microbacterium oleivorans]|uniref:hypothetical protein n=1 Tax=Microbacterium oleivorans TaxID=273677 RepID=UPI00203CD7F1|nr:hypothetical protein [Microbacterium oleivorans]MCM3696411.1 hypothetical protein [Microbacterium oleivorans]